MRCMSAREAVGAAGACGLWHNNGLLQGGLLMHLLIDAVLFTWDKNLDYTRRLLADVPEDKMALQPAPT